MNVGEWLRMQVKAIISYVGIDGEEMVEIAPFCYLNRTAYDAGYSQSKPRVVSGEYIASVPIGNSLTPWREWGTEYEGWKAKRSYRVHVSDEWRT